MTRCSGSLLAVAASERKFELRVSFSKYSTRQGHQSVSISDLGNSFAIAVGCETKFPTGKVEQAFAAEGDRTATEGRAYRRAVATPLCRGAPPHSIWP